MASLSPLKILRHILFATAPLIESHASSFQEFREGSEKRMLHIFFFFRGKILRQEKVQESSDFLQSFWCFFALYDALLGNKGQKRPFEMICCRKNLNRLQYENMCISNDFMFNNIQLMLEWHESSLSEIWNMYLEWGKWMSGDIQNYQINWKIITKMYSFENMNISTYSLRSLKIE